MARVRRRGPARLAIVLLACAAIVSSPARPAQAGEGNHNAWGSREDGLFLEYTVTGLDVGPVVNGWADATITSATVTVSGTAFISLGEGLVTRPGMSLDIGNQGTRVQSYTWPPDSLRGPDGYVSGPFAEEHSFSFTHSVQAGDDRVSIHLGVGKSNGASEVLSVTIVAWVSPDTSIPGLSTDTRPTGEQTTTTEPSRPVTVSGKVTVPTGMKGTEQPGVLPIAAAPLRAYHGDELLATTLIDPDGSYRVDVPGRTKDVTLEVELKNQDFVRVVDDQSTDPAVVVTEPFDVGKDPLTKDLSLDPAAGVRGKNLPDGHVTGAGRVYAYLYQAWYEAAVNLGIPLDFNPPLDAKVYSTEAGSSGQPSTYAAISAYPGDSVTDPYLNYDAAKMAETEALQFVVIHEFGHYVQTDLQGNLYPHDPANTYHDGYANPSTTDSWTEGFATFFVLLVGRDVEGDTRALVSYYGGGELDFDLAAYLPWDQSGGVGIAEEFAVAGMLWDLVDGWPNANPLQASAAYAESMGVQIPGGIGTEQQMRPYMDKVEMNAQELMMLLGGDVSGVDPSPVTTAEGMPAYRGVFDLQQLHSMLVAQGVGQETDVGYRGLTRLGAVFVGHGLFADTSPPNLFWDPGEAVGTVSHVAMAIGGEAVPDRSTRRVPPPVPDATLALSATKDGRAVVVDTYQVSIEYEPNAQLDAQHYDRTYLATPADDGTLTLLLPDPQWRCRAVVTPAGGWASAEPFVIDSASYRAALNDGVPGPLAHHTFEVTGGPPSGGGTSTGGLALVGIGALGVLGFGWALARRRAPTPPPPAPPEPR